MSVRANAQTRTADRSSAIDHNLLKRLRIMFAFGEIASMIAAQMNETDERMSGTYWVACMFQRDHVAIQK
jgi:hypothetical protein